LANILLIPDWVRKDHFLEIAFVLRDAGHDVTFASFLDIGSGVQAHGFHFVQLDRGRPWVPEAPLRYLLPGPLGKAQRWLTRWASRRTRRDAQATRYRMVEKIEKLEELSPDLVLIDIELPAYVFAALSARMRVALVATILSLWKRQGLPPQHRSLSPPDGDTTASKRFEVAWLQLRAWKWWRRQIDYLRMAGADRTAMLRQFGERHGLQWHDIVDPWQWQHPFSYRTLPVINLNARELDFPHDPCPELHFVGPVMCHRRDVPANLDEEDRSRLEACLQRRRSGGSGSLLYCAFGRYAESYEQGLLERLFMACRQRPEWTLLVALGGRDSLPTLDRFPPNVHTFRWLPQLTVLQEADCAIIHAGISSINECIYHEVPMILYPLRLNDQQGNAARVAWHGLGIRAHRETDTADDMIEHIDHAMSSKSIRARLSEMNKQCQRYVDDQSILTAVNAVMRPSGTRGHST
jgi:hypothetical protein